jgi:hypothetical protein
VNEITCTHVPRISNVRKVENALVNSVYRVAETAIISVIRHRKVSHAVIF